MPKQKLRFRSWAQTMQNLGTGATFFNLHSKSRVPRAWETHDRLRLTETVSLLRKLWGVLWICQFGAPKPFSGCIKPRAPLDQLPPAVFKFQKIGNLAPKGPQGQFFWFFGSRDPKIWVRNGPGINLGRFRGHMEPWGPISGNFGFL